MRLGAKLAIGFGLFTAAAVGIAWWWTHNMVRKWEPENVYLFSQGKYDHLALRRILERQGIRVEFRDHIGDILGSLRTTDAVFLPNIPYFMPSPLADSLLEWVGNGGTLLMDSPWDIDSTNDALTRPLGILVRRPPKDSNSNLDENDSDAKDKNGIFQPSDPEPSDASSSAKPDSVSDASARTILPGLPEPVLDSLVDQPDAEYEDDSGETDSDTTAAPRIDSGSVIRFPGESEPLHISSREYAPVIVSVPAANTVWRDSLDSTTLVVSHRRGFVAATTTIWRFSNLPIQDLDHAEFTLRLLSWRQKPACVWIVKGTYGLSRWQWLWSRAWAVVLLALLVAGFWVWNRSRRFGPPLPDPETDRRPLLEHVDASARWIWNSPEGPETLVRALRASVRRHITARHPAWARLPLQDLSEELARLHGVSTALVQRALGPEDPEIQTAPSPQELVVIVKLLQKFKDRS